MYRCEYCQTELSSKTNLRTHQTRAKYCLDIQQQSSPVVVTVIQYHCTFCNKTSGTKQQNTIHEHTCSVVSSTVRHECERLKLEISTLSSTLQATIISLQSKTHEYDELRVAYDLLSSTVASDKLYHEREKTKIYSDLLTREQELTKSLSNKASTVINSKTINMGNLNLSVERLAPLCSTFTLEHYNRGGAGSADWVVDNILTDDSGKLIYRCTDKNRKQFVYRDDSGVLVNDVNADRLKAVILPLMRSKILEYRNDAYARLGDMSDDGESTILTGYSDTYRQHSRLGSEFERRLVQKTYI